MKSIEKDTTTKAEQEAGKQYTLGRCAAIDSAQAAVIQALVNNQHIKSDTADDLRRTARTAAGISYTDGAQ
ncbi:hypothetical protein ACFWD7_29515 [Streptomyces mirabilis]|uniref:hypothetical protein n=1 Tax=Streptomyces mirabilis TaxID=68239 RepID=UPI0036C274AB